MLLAGEDLISSVFLSNARGFFFMSVDVSFQIGQCDEYYTQLTFSSSHSALDDHCMIIYIL